MKFSTDSKPEDDKKGYHLDFQCPCKECTYRGNKIWEGNCRLCMTVPAKSKNQWPGFEGTIDSGIKKSYRGKLHTPVGTFSFGNMPKQEIGEEKSE